MMKAAEVLGERWTLLVVRELLAGSTRYAELKRGVGRISPSVLSSRIKTLIDHGIVERVGAEYRLTPAGLELAPIIESIGEWGRRWLRGRVSRDDLDVEHLMIRVQRGFDLRAFPERHAVVGFVFRDLHGAQRRWWILLDDGELELCTRPLGRPEDVTLTCELRTLSEIVTGEITVETACRTKRLEVRGPERLVRSVHRWLRITRIAEKLP